MKRKDLIELLVAVVILAVAGFFIFSLLAPHKAGAGSKAKAATYVKVTPIGPSIDQTGITRLSDSSKVRDFYSPPDLSNGLNNPQPFGPLQ